MVRSTIVGHPHFMTTEAAAHYLRDLGDQLVRLHHDRSSEHDRTNSDFEAGHRLAVYEVITVMLTQAEAFGLTAADVGLESVDPERDLL